MVYTDNFYYEQKQSKLTYSDIPTGTPNIDRLIRGLPYWSAPNAAAEKKPKKLIIANTFCSNWPPNRKEKLLGELLELKKKGFSLYCWSKGALIPLDDSMTEFPSSSQGKEEEIIAAAAGLRIPRNEIHILDNHGLRQFLSDHELTERKFYVRDFKKPYREEQIKAMIALFANAKPPLSELVFDTLDTDPDQAFLYALCSDIIQKNHPKIRLTTSYDRGRFYDNTRLAELVRHAHDIEYLEFQRLSDLAHKEYEGLAFPKLKQLIVKNLVLKKGDNPEVIGRRIEGFLRTTPQLTSLVLALTNDELSPFEWEELTLSQLKHLELASVECSYHFLTQIIGQSTLLNSLHIHSSLLYGDIPDKLSLAMVQSLRVEDCELEGHHLGTMLQRSPLLSNLDLQDTTLSSALPTSLSLPNLKKLNLRGTKLTEICLEQLIRAAPNLEEIDLGTLSPKFLTHTFLCHTLPKLKKIVSGIPSLEECESSSSSKALEKLSFRSLDWRDINFEQCLTAYPNLKALSVHQCTVEKAISHRTCMAQLEKITLSQSVVSTKTMCAMIKSAPNLTTFKAINCSFKADATLDFPLPLLKHLELKQPHRGSSLILELFLPLCPNLESLAMEGLSLLELPHEALCFNTLRVLHVHRCTLHNEQYYRLLNQAEHLEELVLEHIPQAELLGSLKEQALHRLNKLTLSDVHASTIMQLLPKAKGLGELTLRDMFTKQNNAFTFPAGITLPHLHTLRVEFCILSADDLLRLIRMTPETTEIYLKSVTTSPSDELKELLKARKALCSPELLDQSLKLPMSSTVSKPVIHEATLDKAHDPSIKQHYDPRPSSTSRNVVNLSKNQMMLIDKLSHYLRLKKQHLDVIPKLQKGICNALAHYFHDHTDEQWAQFIAALSSWDGLSLSKAPCDKLDELLTYIQTHMFHGRPTAKERYIGDNLHLFLEAMPHPSSAILYNPWHAITIQRCDKTTWVVYDPNYHGGAKTLSHGQVLHEITRAIGSIVSTVSPTAPIVAPLISDANKFIAGGGLINLSHSKEAQAMLRQLPPVHHLALPSLDGLTLRDNKGIPAWFLNLRNPQTAPYTYALLTEFISRKKDNFECLSQSIAHVPLFKRHALTALLVEHQDAKGYGALPGLTELVQRILREAPCLHPVAEGQEEDLSEALETISNRHVPPDAKKALISEISEAQKTGIPLQQKTKELLSALRNDTEYDSLFSTWDNKERHAASVKAYADFVLKPNAKCIKRLITTTSVQESKGLLCALQKEAQDTHRPFFYVHSPDDLVCSAAFITRDGANKGCVSRGPGGALHDFLTTSTSHKQPILLINYDNFTHEDLVRFNTLLDTTRSADGTPLTDDVALVGVLNTQNPDVYDGADFYSRFDHRESCPQSLDFASEMPKMPKASILDETLSKHPIINFYHGSDWKERLLGRWVLKENQLEYVPGELSTALKPDTKELVLHNAPWDDEEFTSWWQQAMTTHSVDNNRLNLPRGLILHRTEGYDWAELRTWCANATSVVTDPVLLNPGSLNGLLQDYHCKDSLLLTQPGLIEQAAKKGQNCLAIHLTRSLSEDDWARILTECKTHKVRLDVSCSPKVTLPKELAHLIVHIEAVHTGAVHTGAVHTGAVPDGAENDAAIDRRCAVIASDDCDVTIQQITDNESWITIDVSECSPAHLFATITGGLVDAKSPFFTFSTTQSYLEQALAQGKKIILTGTIPVELVDALAPLLLQRQEACTKGLPLAGHLMIVSHNTEHLAYANPHHCAVSVAEKRRLLDRHHLRAEQRDVVERLLLDNAPFAVIKAHLATTHPFEGFEALPNQGIPEDSLDYAQSEMQANAFMRGRKTALDTLLSEQPYAFLTGLSGVGKTTFIHNEWAEKEDKIYTGFHELPQWIADKRTKGRAVFFIDEANLSSKQYSEFEGLFNTPPTLFINGVLHALGPQHKVIFAGNPINYGDERILAPFFKRHGNALLFKPLPYSVLYHRVLQPVFAHQGLTDEHEQAVCSTILACYKTLCGYSRKELLISPRELQMMALLITHRHRQQPKESLELVTKQVVYTLAAPLVPKEHQTEFALLFQPTMPAPPPKVPLIKGFSLPPSRQSIWQTIGERLELRSHRRTTKDLNEAQTYGGLGGLIIEGEPGVGKSELVIRALLHQGFINSKNKKPTDSPQQDYFYHLQASMPIAEKQELLIKAFHEGAVVVLDEINTSPMLEQLMNGLLMGYHGEERPKVPGFMIIGTQNPITMSGRRAASTALERRLTKITMALPSAGELMTLISDKGLPHDQAQKLVTSFLKQLHHAKKEGLSPEPTLRQLLRAADRIYPSSLEMEWKKPVRIDDTKSAVLHALRDHNIHEALIKLSPLALKEQSALLDSCAKDASLRFCANKAKTRILFTALIALRQLGEGQPIIQLIGKKLSTMSYNAAAKKEQTLIALDELQRQAQDSNDWERKVIAAIKNPQSALYQALNTKRYGLQSPFFPSEAKTLKQVKNAIASLEMEQHEQGIGKLPLHPK